MSDSDDECDELSDSEFARRLASQMGDESATLQSAAPQSQAALETLAVAPPEKAAQSAVEAPAASLRAKAAQSAFHAADETKSKLGGARVELINTVSRSSAVCQKLQGHDALAIDIEGVKLGRHGDICIIQIAERQGSVFLFDITVLGKLAFASGLKDILESEHIAKLFFDIRCDADALSHLYGIKPSNVLDMQVLCQKAICGDSQFVLGIAKAVGHVVPTAETDFMKGIKEAGTALFAPDKGGKLEIWRQRPLPEVLIEYCAQDVVHLHTMLSKWGGCLARSTLRTVSEIRMSRRIQSKVVPTGPHLARKDFEFPYVSVTASKALTMPHVNKLKPTITAVVGQRHTANGNKVLVLDPKALPAKPATQMLSPKAKAFPGTAKAFSVTARVFSPKLKPTVTAKGVVQVPVSLKPTVQAKDVAAAKGGHPVKPMTSTDFVRAADIEPAAKRQRQGGLGHSFQ